MKAKNNIKYQILLIILLITFVECKKNNESNSKINDNLREITVSKKFKSYIDSLLFQRTNNSFITEDEYRVYRNKNDTTEFIKVNIDTLAFEIVKKYMYRLNSKTGDKFIFSLIDELKQLSEIKKDYYYIRAETSEICADNEYMERPDCHDEVTDFTFLNKEKKPVCTYFWWRGSLSRKKIYFYKKDILVNTKISNF